MVTSPCGFFLVSHLPVNQNLPPFELFFLAALSSSQMLSTLHLSHYFKVPGFFKYVALRADLPEGGKCFLNEQSYHCERISYRSKFLGKKDKGHFCQVHLHSFDGGNTCKISYYKHTPHPVLCNSGSSSFSWSCIVQKEMFRLKMKN